MIIQLRRWLPDRRIVVVTDMGYAALELLHSCQSLRQPVTFISRLRLDAALFEPAPPRLPGQIGRPRLKGRRLPSPIELLDNPDVSWSRLSVPWKDGPARTLEITSETRSLVIAGEGPPVHIRWVLIRDPLCQMRTQALVCTDTEADPFRIIQWFLLRWRVEVTFQEVRAHLGVETQRQWSDKAITRTTPLLLGIFSWVTLAAGLLRRETPGCPAFVRLVRQVRTHFHRRHRSGTPASVVRFSDFFHFPIRARCGESPPAVVQPPCRFPLPMRLEG